jgi:hypothetical protein
MPFDRIFVSMSLEVLYECGVSLFFEYFRLEQGGKKSKLATGVHRAAWLVGAVAAPLPSEILSAVQGKLADSDF